MNTNGTPNSTQSQINPNSNQGSFHLAPLSSGGFIYSPYWPSVQYPPYPTPAFTPVSPSSPLSPPPSTPSTPTYVSQGIADRQDKLEKYRDKRSKRNFNRAVDATRRDRACARTRDEKGQFSAEKPRSNKLSVNERETMLQALELSQMQSNQLKDQLSAVHRELLEMRAKLEEQQQLNQQLANENKILFSTTNETFNTVRPSKYNSTFVDAFKEKVDLSLIELNWTDSPHLEAARVEDSDFEQRWEEMTFIAGATP
eukprot:TRINITY_DN1750_c0_g1_i1.p1 TRINITY_DN1750_c0_g1~~TRINITY_DN1750_c0_g1_i1.p1  ORF type:complete len:256 (-),score=50.73 TRINITY_DN1750_c0_g1_i1:484-1251(-)